MGGYIELQQDPSQPPTVVCKNGSSVGICTCCTHVFCKFRADLHAQWVIIDKTSASELGRKFIKSELLVGIVEFYVL